ncbi:hypothetical protein EDC14_1003129 [Hydrogenispora ethanolica]|uniref:Uncharacterized protein n=1 Tax=Hydrogenispora ethanolica TaxID=1082276 RepID=A0A4V2QGC3_HYDET|nr:hypothetical protein [Hydrogenispora ethanolica]TCL75197.1 hypothetical protein EDC14_1003129 [Hydrogenispora ethanolica]
MRIKTIFLVLMLLFAVSSPSLAAGAPLDYDFRNTCWGMSKAEVASHESLAPLDLGGGELAYLTTIDGKNCLLFYSFHEDRLYLGGYLFLVEHTNPNDYISDYNSLKQLLDKKYGEAGQSGMDWRNDHYRENQNEWGRAVSLGHLLYYSIWETPRTEITMGLSGENHDVKLMIGYESKEYGPEAASRRDEATIKDL